MIEVAANTSCILTIQHSYNGASLTLTGLDYALYDAVGTELVARTSVPGFNGSNSQSTVTISAASNTSSKRRDVRQAKFWLINAEGERIVNSVYILKGDELQLSVPSESFQTFPEAVATRLNMPDALTYYDALPDETKVTALEAAFLRLQNLTFNIAGTDGLPLSDIAEMSPSAFRALNPKFILALQRAQLVEADVLVEASPIAEKIRQGIISETIGESSMFFRSDGKTIDSKIPHLSDKAYPYLSDWIYKNTSSSQIWKVRRA